ncbi:hypothetical protein [Pseudomonas graminis]
MNIFIFQRLFDNRSVHKALIASTECTDDIGVALRLHLITENFLEAFICASIGKENLFDPKPNSGRPFKLNYFKKLELAEKFGLPIQSFRVLDKFNSLRNDLAHKITTETIDKNLIASLADLVRNLDNDIDLRLDDECAEFFNAQGTSNGVFPFKSEETPNRIKLIIIISSFIRRTISKCIGFYQLHTHMEFIHTNTNSSTVL